MSQDSTNHLFVSNVRFWSMVAIVAIHSLQAWGDVTRSLDGTGSLQLLLLQCFKFATPAFFLISGFLLGGRMDRSRPAAYFQRRFEKVGMPWLCWAAGWWIFTWLMYERHLPALTLLHYRTFDVFFYSIYWFVPNSLFSLGILLLCRRWLDSKRFGALLFSVSLFYGLNSYLAWLPQQHTAALGAYVSYLWLGNWTYRHYGQVRQFVERIRFRSLWFGVLICELLGIVETLFLIEQGQPDCATTLRISNQIFSVFAALLLMKAKPCWPKFIHVRQETFGIYLIHPFTLWVGRGIVNRLYFRATGNTLAGNATVWHTAYLAAGCWLLEFVLAYGLALSVTKLLIRSGLGHLVGAERSPVYAYAGAAPAAPSEPLLQAA